MKNYIISTVWFLIACFLIGCEQRISIKETSLTGINQLSFTDVIFKSNRDTVLVSGFNGIITEVINHNSVLKKRVIIDLQDEIYSLAYNYSENLIYASTFNKGVIIIDELNGEVETQLQIKDKWTTNIHYNPSSKILLASGYTENSYLWDADNNYVRLKTPEEFGKMQPKFISDNGTIYFDGIGVMGTWDIKIDDTPKTSKLRGRISDADNRGRVLAISDKNYILKNATLDSILIQNKHPNWPIFVSSKDTTVRVPVSLPLTDAIFSKSNIYTSSIDRSIRKWNIVNGELMEDLLGHRATISALSLSRDATQLVSVDLKGGIKFWDLNNDN